VGGPETCIAMIVGCGLGRESIHPSTNPNHGLMIGTALAGDEGIAERRSTPGGRKGGGGEKKWEGGPVADEDDRW
jgi:hypothetical protein